MNYDSRTNFILTLLALLPMLVSTGAFAMETDQLLKRGERAIIQLHQFFQDWYRGNEEAEFNHFDQALSDGFTIIMPDGRILDRGTIIEAVRGQHDSDSQAELEIRNVRLHEVHDATATQPERPRNPFDSDILVELLVMARTLRLWWITKNSTRAARHAIAFPPSTSRSMSVPTKPPFLAMTN